MSLQCDNLSGELQDQWSSSLQIVNIAYPKYSVSEEEDSLTNSEHSLSRILRATGRGLFYKLK